MLKEALKTKTELNDSNSVNVPSRLGWSDFQILFKAMLLITSGTWMNQGSFLKPFQILG